MYAKNLGRFTSVDPIFSEIKRLIDPQRINLYVYGRDNPLKFTDSTGMILEIKGKDSDEVLRTYALLLKGLKKGDREHVHLVAGSGKNGIRKGTWGIKVDEDHKSKSENFNIIKAIAKDSEVAELKMVKTGEIVEANYAAVVNGQTVLTPTSASPYWAGTKGFSLSKKDFVGWTSFPVDNPPSTETYPIYSNDDRTKANVLKDQKEIEIVVTMFHELAAHVFYQMLEEIRHKVGMVIQKSKQR